jgi:hypothetical protein
MLHLGLLVRLVMHLLLLLLLLLLSLLLLERGAGGLVHRLEVWITCWGALWPDLLERLRRVTEPVQGHELPHEPLNLRGEEQPGVLAHVAQFGPNPLTPDDPRVGGSSGAGVVTAQTLHHLNHAVIDAVDAGADLGARSIPGRALGR